MSQLRAPANVDADGRAPASHDHIVQFYADDGELARRVGAYLADGLLHGERAVVIATPQHLAGLALELEHRGVPVEAAVGAGDYVVFDAADTLAKFMIDGWPDPVAYDAVVGDVVRALTSAGRPVRAFGEMVALLWEGGNAPAAIELETLWNRLRANEAFALYCAYRAEVDGAVVLSAFEDVCRTHGVVLPIDEFGPTSCRFLPTVDAGAAARTFVRDALIRGGRRDACDAAEMVIAELAANAIAHARTEFVVTIEWHDPDIRISVRDFTRSIPAARYGGTLALSGRGLHMVGATAARWGSDLLPDGKVVWADIRL